MSIVQTEIDFPRTALKIYYSNLDGLLKGKEEALKGMQRAETHANQVHDKWSEDAYKFLLIFLRHSKTDFMVEDVRAACKGVVPEAPTSRAWGAIILRAAKARLVKKVGIRSVKNSNAHRANAAVWTKL